ncbi:MAG: hypothetical protein ACRESZ_02660 [Methylococcales bacterium]
MTLMDQAKTILNRLAPQGWAPLLARHGLNLTATDLSAELSRDLPGINRSVPGFEDFAREGRRGIEPGNPARSLLYHAFSSLNVTRTANGSPLTAFPTLAELEIIENLVYGSSPPSLAELRARAQGAPLAIVVYAYEYRPATRGRDGATPSCRPVFLPYRCGAHRRRPGPVRACATRLPALRRGRRSCASGFAGMRKAGLGPRRCDRGSGNGPACCFPASLRIATGFGGIRWLT